MVAASLVSGTSINKVTRRFSIRWNPLTAWRRRQAREIAASKSKRERAQFAAVRLKAVAMDAMIEIDQAGGLVRVRGIVDPRMLHEVLASIRWLGYRSAHVHGLHAMSRIYARFTAVDFTRRDRLESTAKTHTGARGVIKLPML
jgi:hypothetical protein